LRYVKTHNFDPPLSGGRLDAASLNFTQEWCVAGGVNDNDNDVGGIAFLSMSEHKKRESSSLLLHNTNLPAVSRCLLLLQCPFSTRWTGKSDRDKGTLSCEVIFERFQKGDSKSSKSKVRSI